MNLKGFGRKWSLPNCKVLSRDSCEGLRKTTKNLRIAGLWAKIWTRDLLSTIRSVNHFTRSFGHAQPSQFILTTVCPANDVATRSRQMLQERVELEHLTFQSFLFFCPDFYLCGTHECSLQQRQKEVSYIVVLGVVLLGEHPSGQISHWVYKTYSRILSVHHICSLFVSLMSSAALYVVDICSLFNCVRPT
jgi:hypothetical protein